MGYRGTALCRSPLLSVEKRAGRNLAGFSQALIQHGFRPPLAGCAAEDVPPSALSPRQVKVGMTFTS